MRIILIAAIALLALSSCNNNGKGKPFCDTTCRTEPLRFGGDNEFKQSVTISLKNCMADTISWTYNKMLNSREMQVTELLNQPVKINKEALSCVFQDTTMAWVTFNDCTNGRGYLLKLPFNKTQKIQKITGALNSFDKSFSVDPDLRAYTDRGNLFVVNVKTGKEAQLSFDKIYDIDFNDIHKYVKDASITKQKIAITVIDKDGREAPFEKKVDL